MMPDSQAEQTFIQRAWIAVAIVLLAILLLLLIYYTFDVILLVFAAGLIAIFLRGLADFLGRFEKLSDGKAVLLVTLLLLAVIAGTVALLAPSVAEQAQLLRTKLPASARMVSEYLSQFSWGRTIIDQLPSADDVIQRIDASSMLTRVGGFFSSTVGVVGNFFITILLAIYFAIEPRFYAKGFTKLFPIERRERVGEIITAVYQTLRWWLIGKAASMLFIGVLTWIGLSILGVPLALTLGLLAGLLSFIPNFGPIMSAVPAILLAFIESPITAVYVAALFIGVQLIESNVVTPLIERETIELPPALTIVFQLGLAVMVGGLGLVLATPLLAVAVVLVQMVYIEDVLGDHEAANEMETVSKANERSASE